MKTNNNEIKSLEARGMPSSRVDYQNEETLLMRAPSDLGVALAEMERKDVITLEQFKKEFRQWCKPAVRMPRVNMVFTKHFVAQLHEVLAYYEETKGYPDFSCAIIECLFRDLRKLFQAPIKGSYPTTNPKVRYIMPLSINVTFYYDLEALTILSICK